MAGFFGLVNYEKEGPGVEKNAPKKKSFIVFFELFFKNFWKIAFSSFCFLLLSLPVITYGLAAVGFTNVTRNLALDTHSFGVSDFFETIKKNWKQALPAGIINTVILVWLIWDLYFFYNNTTGVFSVIAMAAVLTVLIVFIMMGYYMWTIMITFKLKLKQIYVNSFKFAIIGLKRNLLISVLLLVVYAAIFCLLLINRNIFTLLFVLLAVFVIPGFRFLLVEFNIFEKIKKFMIVPYYKEHPDEDLELRRRLGVEED